MFCVISPTVDASGTKRTWKKTQAEAAKHGQRLLSEQAARSGKGGGGRRLFIVKVVEVVELPGPTVNRRKPEADDFDQMGVDLNEA